MSIILSSHGIVPNNKKKSTDILVTSPNDEGPAEGSEGVSRLFARAVSQPRLGHPLDGGVKLDNLGQLAVLAPSGAGQK